MSRFHETDYWIGLAKRAIDSLEQTDFQADKLSITVLLQQIKANIEYEHQQDMDENIGHEQ